MDGLPWLGKKMQLTAKENGAIWSLIGNADQEARMFLTDFNVRAALDILYKNYTQMEWSLDRFPEWIVNSAEQAAPANAILH